MDLCSRLPATVKDPSDPHRKKPKNTEALNSLLIECVPASRHFAGEVENLKNKCLLLDSVRKAWKPTSSARCRNTMSAKDRRRLKVFDIGKEGHKYEDYIPFHTLWQDYMRDLLDMARFESASVNPKKENYERLLKADYHGCSIVVRKSRCPSLVGVAGIILMETRNTFKVITRDNKIKCLPKMHSLFSFELDGYMFTMVGSQFCVKSCLRVRKKFKFKGPVDV